MSDAENPKQTRRQHITREEEADRCLNHTVYSHGSQVLTVFVFLLVVFGVPIAQHVVEIRQNLAKRAEWNPSSGQPKPGIAPQIYDVFGLLPTGDQLKQAKGFWGYWDLIPSVEKISGFETSLKENSVLTTSLLSPTQLLMTKLGAGNEKAYIGRDGWLFYRPDVEYLTSAGFLEPTRLKERSHGAMVIQPDPVKAILDFKQQLADRGVQLVVMPMSTKPMIQPEMLVGSSAAGAELQNGSFPDFVKLLEGNGVQVFDPTPVLRGLASQGGKKQFLESDTHWTPDAMHEVALKLGQFLRAKDGFGLTPEPFELKPQDVSNLGDIAEMLKLPADQAIFPKQKVTIQKVVGKDGTPWQPDRGAEVLVMGDSFANIYSLEGMGWGDSAGFAEHLSYAIARPLDKIVINAGGAFASRQELARQLAHGVDRLANKRVVVYEFSMRDLAQGDWKMIKLPQPPKVDVVTPTVKPAQPVGTKQLTTFSAITVAPATIDLSKHEKFQFSSPVPPGNSVMSVISPDGTVLRKLTGMGTLVNTTIKGSWDGTNVYGKPVSPGIYTFRLEGNRSDKSIIDPITFPVAVVDGKSKAPVLPPAVKPGKPLTTPGPKAVNPVPPKTGTTGQAPPPNPVDAGLIVTGRIAARPVTPKPGSVPYKDCVIALQLTDLKVSGGTVKGANIVVYVWGMKDNNLVDGAFSVGQTLQFKLTPWAKVDSKYGGYNRQELDNDDALNWEAYWGEIK